MFSFKETYSQSGEGLHAGEKKKKKKMPVCIAEFWTYFKILNKIIILENIEESIHKPYRKKRRQICTAQ